jgi:hypothetical protein
MATNNEEIERAQRARHGTPFLSTGQAAAWLGFSLRHLQKLRTRGEGPVFRLHSRRIQYHIDDLLAWSDARATREIRHG